MTTSTVSLFLFVVAWLKITESFRHSLIKPQYQIAFTVYDKASAPDAALCAGRLSEEDSIAPGLQTNTDETVPSLIPETIDVLLQDHKPLGCTIEESLVPSSDLGRTEYLPVMISKLVSGGNAENAGLKVGDVIIGVSAVFGDEIQDSSTLGLYKLQSLISGRQPEKPLMIRVLRGTNLLQRHEEALMELCMSHTADDKSWDSCVVTSIHSYDDNQTVEDEATTPLCIAGDDEVGCLLTAIWGEENLLLVEDGSTSVVDGALMSEEQQMPEPKAIAPWSSRSSPSGTYAHNTKTNKIEKID